MFIQATQHHFVDLDRDVLQDKQHLIEDIIEAVRDAPAAGAALRGVAVLAHPHPLHGGSMHNKVVTMAARSLRELGATTLRFNFRSVGKSAGRFDHGNGERDDLLAVVADSSMVSPSR